MDLSIAVISYNTRDLLLACLQSVQDRTTDVDYELIVVDNASRDRSVEAVRARFPQVTVIANADNGGYAKACNQAAAVSSGRYVLLLNSDTVMQAHTLRTMVTCLDQSPDVGAVSCKQWTGDGQLYQSCFPFPSIRDHLRHAACFQQLAPNAQAAVAAAHAIDCAQSQDVDWINGACLMVRRDLMEHCGGLDETFFMYFEDVDLCQAIRRRGYRVRHLAEADIVHLIGRSSERDRTRLNVEWEFSRIRYVEKHFPPIKRWIMKFWIAASAVVRLLRMLGCRGSIAQGPPIGAYLSVVQRLWRVRRANEAPLLFRTEARG